MIENDRSYITVVILSLYAAFSIHCMVLTLRISKDIQHLHQVQYLISRDKNGFRIESGTVIIKDDQPLVECTATSHNSEPHNNVGSARGCALGPNTDAAQAG